MSHEEAKIAEEDPKIKAREIQVDKFWRDDPQMWFRMLDREFAKYNVKSNAVKCAAVIQHLELDEEIKEVMANIISSPDMRDSYPELVEAVIDRIYENNQLRQLLARLTLNGREPSVLLRIMTFEAESRLSESVLQNLWLQKLPPNVQDILAVVEDIGLNKLALLADKIMEQLDYEEESSVSEYDGYQEAEGYSEIAELTDKIEKLEMLVRKNMKMQRVYQRQRNKQQQQHTEVPTGRFEHIYVKIVGPLQPSNYFQYCLTIIDEFTLWPEAIPLIDATADTVTTALFNNWITRFGTPITIITDHNSQFESFIFQSLTELLGCRRYRMTADQPPFNGLVERSHRSLKAAIMCHENRWTEILPTVLLGLRTSFKKDIKTTAAEMLYGSSICLPGKFFNQHKYSESECFTKFHQYINRIKPVLTSRCSDWNIFAYKTLYESTHVFVRVYAVREPLDTPYEGPFPVLKILSNSEFLIYYKGKPIKIYTKQLKPAFMEDEETTSAWV